MTEGSTKDRLLLAAATLLAESGDRTASTRAICERAGVQAPTLYHHFGSKQGLIDAVIEHGFTQYVADSGAADPADPVAAIRAGWDRHVRFGLEHPRFYALLYGAVEPGRPCAIASPAQAMLRDLLVAAARAGLLRVPPEDAAARLFAANVGVTLNLITQPEPDLALSEHVRESILAGVLSSESSVLPAGPASPAREAIALHAALEDGEGQLSVGELAILRELLDRLALVPGAGVGGG